MTPPSDTSDAARRAPQGQVALVLCTADGALRAAWQAAGPPVGFRLETDALAPGVLSPDRAALVLVDAEAAAVADGPLADALGRQVSRCVWTGPAAALDRLGEERLLAAYDVLVTPVTPRVLEQRLEAWLRSIRQTAALESLGERADELAGQNSSLRGRISEAEDCAVTLGRQRERLGQALRRIHEVARLSREVNCLDLEQIATACIQRLPGLVGARRASLYLFEAMADRLILVAATPGLAVAKRVDLTENPRSPMALALARGEVLLIAGFEDYERKTDIVVDREFRESYAGGSCIIAPLKGGNEVRGVLNLADKEGSGQFDREIDLPVVEQIAEVVGAGLYNIELYQQMERRAKTDSLTGLANRRALEDALAREMDRVRRYGSPLTVMMLDVDQLKAVNDAEGHAAGDAVLRNLASLLVDTVRSVDAPGRWAGDEFFVVLPGTTATQAERLARRLLSRVHERPVTIGDKAVATSLSVGVAEVNREETAEMLIDRVDQAMYAAKHGGRDRIAIAS
jgi:diguanylate cyclase (GGDEF)-like protein